jgi:hypothetical protein
MFAQISLGAPLSLELAPWPSFKPPGRRADALRFINNGENRPGGVRQGVRNHNAGSVESQGRNCK